MSTTNELLCKVAIVKGSLYRQESPGASFRAFMVQKLDEINFRSSFGDPAIWMRQISKADGEHYLK